MSVSEHVIDESTVSAGASSGYLRASWWTVYAAVMGVTTFVALLAYKRSEQLYFGLCLALLLLLLLSWFRFPRTALGITLFFTLLGDIVTVWWFPFTKNLSSPESIFYIADQISISPLEVSIGVGLVSTVYRNVAATGRLVRRGPLNWPFALFTVFVFVGVMVGLGTGGDTRVALFEVRPLLYLPAMYVVIFNVCRSTTDYLRLLFAGIGAIFLQSLLSLNYYFDLDAGARSQLEALTEHGAAVSMNLMFVALFSVLLLGHFSGRAKLVLAVASVPVVWVYVISQRRAGFVTLVAGAMVLLVVLFWHRRRTFIKVVPLLIVFGLGYLGAFWNSESAAGFPALAVKSVVAPDQLGEKDASSDLYREIEKFDLSVTIRAAPVQGIGFGQPFLRPIPLPDISGFEFNAYIPHNSLLWVWTKVGFFGFVTLLYVFGLSIALGAGRLRRGSRSAPELLVGTCATGFLAMFMIFLYVEIAWEPRNVFLLAWSVAVCTSWIPKQRLRARTLQDDAGGGRNESTMVDSRSA
jgi:hypothetical protein